MKPFHTLATMFSLIAAPVVLAAGININTADREALQQLDGIGPALAEAIVEYREANGGFADPSELTEVSGIGEMTLESIRGDIIAE
ncbi:ComEA family DNA-binding protein [Arhodomonas sp. SL1]|uniref:ComEA family DNA-binding protein n=1 Tax=Arhodomonas sp. SL1 TaxID=3425691 RepID=UPI003F885BF9